MRLTRSMRYGLDAVLIVVAALTVWRLVGATGADNSEVPAFTPAVKRGDLLRWTGIEWSGDRTVVLVLRSTCPACNASVPFYRQLADLAIPGISLMAVSNENTSVLADWMDQNGIRVRDVRRIEPAESKGLTLTPMLLIVDAAGRVTDVMIRKLDERQQASVVARLRNPRAAAIDNSQQIRELSVGDLESMPAGRTLLLDARPRDLFRRGHRSEARNIPLKELGTRASIELDTDKPVVVDCLQPGAAGCRAAAWSLVDRGFSDV